MTVSVPTAMNDIEASHMKTAKPASTTRVALPIQGACNHLLGSILGGLKHATARASGQTTSAHLMVFRHPNAKSLTIAAGQNETVTQTSYLCARAGNGPVVIFSDTVGGPRFSMNVFEATWSSTDTGWSTVIVSTVSRSIGSLAVWDTPRGRLSTGDHRVEHEDSTQPMVALTVWDKIGASEEAGPKAMITQSANAWKDCHPQHVSWWADSALEIDSASWTDPFNGQRFLARTRQRKSETVNAATYYVRSWCDASTTYSYRVTSSNPGGSSDTVTVTGLTNTTEAWVAPITGLSVTCTVDSDLTLEFQRTAGSGTIYVRAWSGGDE
jgi:hypothetical protein